jgi:hypothetical protein
MDIKYSLEWLFHRNVITRKQYETFTKYSTLKPIAEILSTGQQFPIPQGNIVLIPLKMRQFDGSKTPFVLIIPQEFLNHGSSKKHLTCFVGHRFSKEVTNNLRYNLACIFDAFGIKPVYSDTGYRNGQVFNTIISMIRSAHFCIFDNRLTEQKPNVYIEIGAAITLGKPYYFFEFKGTTQKVPSDLAGLVALRYANYRELFHEFALTLPDFIVTHGLKSVR